MLQEEFWEKEAEIIEKEVNSKLGKEEFLPLKEALNEKLKSIQENLTVLSSLTEEAKAAGIKRKLLKYVNYECKLYDYLLL